MDARNNLFAFISYSRDDTFALKKLDDTIKNFKSFQLYNARYNIRFWCDRHIDPGEYWEKEILQNLQNADIVICLISKNFLSSDYIREKELPLALQRQEYSKIRILGILLDDCELGKSGLSQIQIVPKNSDGRLMPVNSWRNQKECWSIIKKGISTCAKNSILGLPEPLRGNVEDLNSFTQKQVTEPFKPLFNKKAKRLKNRKKIKRNTKKNPLIKKVLQNRFFLGFLFAMICFAIIYVKFLR